MYFWESLMFYSVGFFAGKYQDKIVEAIYDFLNRRKKK